MFKNFRQNFENWQTTVVGIVTAVASVLVLFGVLTPEEQGEVVEHAVSLVDAVSAGIAAVGGLWLIFKSKDG